MKTRLFKHYATSFTMLMALLIAGFTAGCEIEKTRDGEMPDVDVQVDADTGQLPAYDIEGPDIDVGTRTTTIEVPKVVVVMEEEEVEVPYIDIDGPNDEDGEEQTIAVAIESTTLYDVDIEEIYMVNNQLWVVSELEVERDEPLEKATRVTDQVMVDAPVMEVHHYIIGERPADFTATNYHFISSRDEIASDLASAKAVYRR